MSAADANESVRPYTLIAELTHRCPLRCVYCSNPLDLVRAHDEIDTETWSRVFTEAEDLGVVQLHLTGGEPLARNDLEALVRKARELDLYSNLITSGIPLTRARLHDLVSAGLNNIQLSIQDSNAEGSQQIAGFDGFNAKLEVAEWVKNEGLPLTVNVVLHRANIDHIEAIIQLADRLHADRLELANVQYHAWAFENRALLLPSPEQLARASSIAREAKAARVGRCEVVYVTPDYFSRYPKACMDGWARRYIHLLPDGTALPCHAARSITSLQFENVKDHSLSSIWNDSASFNVFRGDAWMREPCASCDKRAIDFGGCRCQAFALTGDASATDPACSLAPTHSLIDRARASRSIENDPVRYLYRGSKIANRP